MFTYVPTIDIYEIERQSDRLAVHRKMHLDVPSVPGVPGVLDVPSAQQLTWDGMMLSDAHAAITEAITEVLRDSPDFWTFIESVGNNASATGTAAVVYKGVLLIPDVLNNFTAYNDPPSIIRRKHRVIQSALVEHGAIAAVIDPKFDETWMDARINEYLSDSAWARINASVDMFDATTQT